MIVDSYDYYLWSIGRLNLPAHIEAELLNEELYENLTQEE